MDDHLRAVVRDFTASSSPDRRWELLGADLTAGHCHLRLTFAAGHDHCCFEPGCHLALISEDGWQRWCSLFAAHGVQLPISPLSVHLEGVVEFGALCSATGDANGFSYTETFREPG